PHGSLPGRVRCPLARRARTRRRSARPAPSGGYSNGRAEIRHLPRPKTPCNLTARLRAPVTCVTVGAILHGPITSTTMQVQLPDGTPLTLEDGATGADAASAIGEGLARAALAIRQNGDLKDLSAPLEPDKPIEIVTTKSPDALDLIRHDTAHVLAE